MAFKRLFTGILLGSFLGVLPIHDAATVYAEHTYDHIVQQTIEDGQGPVASSSGQLYKLCKNQLVPINDICLLEGIPGTSIFRINAGTSFLSSAAFIYLGGGAYNWILRIGIAICVLNAVIGGFNIVMSGMDGSGTEEGKSKLIWSLVGLIIFLLAGTILNYINPVGFVK